MQWKPNVIVGKATGINWAADERLRHADPYLVWFDLTNFAGVAVSQVTGVRVLVELNPDRTKGGSRFVVSQVAMAEVDKLCSLMKRGVVNRFELSVPLIGSDQAPSRPELEPRLMHAGDEPAGGRPFVGSRAVVGFVDHGCAFANAKFRTWLNSESGWHTRVAAIWDQGRQTASVTHLVWSVPNEFGYGVQTLRDYRSGVESRGQATYQRLDQYINAYRTGNDIDETRCYANSGYEASRHVATHGTHMMDVATGFPSPVQSVLGVPDAGDTAHDVDIVFVQLPSRVSGRQVTGMLRAHVLDGLRYIVSCAPKTAAVTVNLSYGAYAGPHDGTAMIEEAIDELIDRHSPRLKVVVAAGNSYDKALHAKLAVPGGKVRRFQLALLPDDPTENFVEFWLPDAPDGLTVRVVPSGCHVAHDEGWIGPGEAGSWQVDGSIVCALVFPRKVCQGRVGSMLLLATAPTQVGTSRTAAPYGRWQVEFRNQTDEAVHVKAWCERDEAVLGSEAGPRQARFCLDSEATVTGENSLNCLAYGTKTVVVGAYVVDGAVAQYSSTDVSRKPTVLAPADESSINQGLAATAVLSNATVRLNGTSVAAACVTRMLLEDRYAARPPVGRGKSGGHQPALGAAPHPDAMRVSEVGKGRRGSP